MTEETSPELRVVELERRLADLESNSNSRIIQSELKSLAIRAGIVDLDGLKLLDTTSLILNEQGDIEGADRLLAGLKRGKPWLFQGSSSSTPANAPPVMPPLVRRATQMTHEEWQTARSDLIRRR